MMIQKLQAKLHEGLVVYQHPYYLTSLNEWVGRRVRVEWNGSRICSECSLSFPKLYQGYCYPCSQRLACCDLCIVKPELCHFHHGTCREPQWGLDHCMQSHVVYVALTSHPKIGVTRATQIPTRWIDQGAHWAVPIAKTYSRYHAGLIEKELASDMSDKTDWRDLITGRIDLLDERDTYIAEVQQKLGQVAQQLTLKIEVLELKYFDFQYPVLNFLKKAATVNIEQTPSLSGVLLGIKGQYLLFEQGALNVRKYTGYDMTLELEDV